MEKINVMVFPCGSEIGLEINNALKFNKDIELFGLSSVDSHGKCVYKNYIEGVPFINDDNFIKSINKIIEDNKIDYLIPAYDDVVLYFAKMQGKLKARVIGSSFEVANIARSKNKTYNYFSEYDFIPKTYLYDEINESDLPLFVKPDIGQGSQGAMVVDNIDKLRLYSDLKDEYIFSELLTGQEYTVDCFSQNGELIFASMRERKRVKSGISVSSEVISMPEEVLNIAKVINSKLELIGTWFFQVKLDKSGKYKLLEFATRVSGTMSLDRCRGFNYILNSLYMNEGYEIKTLNKYIDGLIVDRALISRYMFDFEYNYVYIDFDDTLTLKDKVNPEMISLVYQMVNEGKKINIITRHSKNIFETLRNLHIDENLFDSIIKVEKDTMKSEVINHLDSIFIDDSFVERADVSQNIGIPVFDVDSIEVLKNWRY